MYNHLELEESVHYTARLYLTTKQYRKLKDIADETVGDLDTLIELAVEMYLAEPIHIRDDDYYD